MGLVNELTVQEQERKIGATTLGREAQNKTAVKKFKMSIHTACADFIQQARGPAGRRTSVALYGQHIKIISVFVTLKQTADSQ